jgi:hypothetical protein
MKGVRAFHLALTLLSVAGSTSAQVPTPADTFGFEPGADYKLANYEQLSGYYRELAAASDRVILKTIGETTLGRPMLLLLISSEENLLERERHKQGSRRLALARGLSEDDAMRLAREGKAIVWIDSGLHATEVAHAQHAPEFAHWLATSESMEARRIRDNVIVLLMPVMNPDGLDMVVEWYERNLGTPFETAGVPFLYHHYIGHDNNRDWNMFTQKETRAVANQLYHEWFPQIVVNHHQPSPFPGRIWIPPPSDPINPNLDPLMVASYAELGYAMRRRFEEEGKPGVVSGIVFDNWWSGYMTTAPDFHNMIGVLTETAASGYASPSCHDRSDLPATFGGRASHVSTMQPSTHYTNPWLGGCWRLRDAVEYVLTASRAVADHAAKHRESYLFNIYRMGARQIARGNRAEGGPFAHVIALDEQHDPGAAVELLRVLSQAGIEIRRADRTFLADGTEYGVGTYVIPPQAFRPFVVDLLDLKEDPGDADVRSYDVTGYQHAYHMGVRVDRIQQPFPIPEQQVWRIPVPLGQVTGRGDFGHLLSPERNATFQAVNRLFQGGASVAWAEGGFDAAGGDWPAGTIVVRDAARDLLEELARELGVDFVGIDVAPKVRLHQGRLPRIGLYESWTANIDGGWMRFLFDHYEFPYTTLRDRDVRTADLSSYDVIVLPAQPAPSILTGHPPGTMPEEFVGGLGVEGAAALKRFVERGGMVVAVDGATDFVIEQFGLPVRNTLATVSDTDFTNSGTLLRLEVDTEHPLAYGMPREAVAFFVARRGSASRAFQVIPPAEWGDLRAPPQQVEVVARYSAQDVLLSGWARGHDRYLAGRSAMIRVMVGEGSAVLLGFRAHFRAQPHNTFKLLFRPLHHSTQGTTARTDASVGDAAGRRTGSGTKR